MKHFFNEEEKLAIVTSIKEAEKKTSGEIRVHIEARCKKNLMVRTIEVFKKLNIHQTKLQNGVLFYIAVKDRAFTIIGDKGINDLVPSNFWEEAKKIMENRFKENKFKEGICEAITLVGNQLGLFFPKLTDDKNELSDDLSFSIS